MVVLLTVGLSLAAQTTQELFLSQQTAESTRVFNAAEAGVEQALSSDLNFQGDSSAGTVTAVSDVNVDYTINKRYNLETTLFEGITVMVDVRGSAGQDLRIEWSKITDCAQDPASLLVAIYSNNGGTIRMRQLPLSGCNPNTRGDGFSITGVTNINVDGYQRRYVLDLQPTDEYVRIKPVYNDTAVRVAGEGWQLPVQFYNIRSEAQSDLGDETRIVEVNRTLPTAPSVFDFALYSGSALNK